MLTLTSLLEIFAWMQPSHQAGGKRRLEQVEYGWRTTL